MNRREFIVGAAGAAVASPLGVRAQPAKMPVIGFLGTSSAAAWREQVAAFEQRLSELGWSADRTIDIDYRWTDGHNEQARAIADAFVARKVDVMVVGGDAVPAAKLATASIPIVFPVAIDPLGSGFVDSLSRPGGNVTGLSLQGADVAGKRLAMLREVVPDLHRLSILVNVSYSAAKKEMEKCAAAARALGLETSMAAVTVPEDIPSALASIQGTADGLYVVGDALMGSNYGHISSLALRARLPTMFSNTAAIAAGGLMAYGPSRPDLFRRAAEYVDKILRGTKPGDIPVEQPTKFILAVNVATAKALGVTVPPSLLALADEVIE